MKTILQSRTFWAQVVGTLALLLTLSGKAEVLDEETQVAVVGLAWATTNVIIRLFTSTPVTLK